MFNFGAGRARLIPAGGGLPQELGVVQSASVDLKVDLKELRGPYRFPIAVADGKGTASGKVSFMQLWPSSLGAILGGTVNSATGPTAAIGESHTIPATSAYTFTLTNGSVLVAGSEIVVVTENSNQVFYTRVTAGMEAAATAANPTGGKYSITGAGVLTFAAGDAGNTAQVTYLYTPASNTATTQVALQQVGMNTASTFQLTLIGIGKNIYTNAAQQFIVQMNTCLAPSLSFMFKLDDFTQLDLDFQAFLDQNGNLGSFYLVNP
jgi:hypothetical protein